MEIKHGSYDSQLDLLTIEPNGKVRNATQTRKPIKWLLSEDDFPAGTKAWSIHTFILVSNLLSYSTNSTCNVFAFHRDVALNQKLCTWFQNRPDCYWSHQWVVDNGTAIIYVVTCEKDRLGLTEWADADEQRSTQARGGFSCGRRSP